MDRRLTELFPHEFEALLEALRRDMQSQLDLARISPDWADWHKMNARQDQRLLKTLASK